MRRVITKLFILVAFANILIGGFALLTFRFTVVPLVLWLGSLGRSQMETLLSFAAKCQIAFGLMLIVFAAIIGRRLIPNQKG